MADIDDLKAAFAQLVKAGIARDLHGLTTLWHEQIVTFQPFSPFPVEGKTAQRQVFQALFAIVRVSAACPSIRNSASSGTWGLSGVTLLWRSSPKTVLCKPLSFAPPSPLRSQTGSGSSCSCTTRLSQQETSCYTRGVGRLPVCLFGEE